MKTRYYQKLHDYIFATLADTEKDITAKPESHRASYRAKRIEQTQQFFFAEEKALIKQEDRLQFRSALRQLNAEQLEVVLYGNNTDTLDEKQHTYPIPDDKEISNQFHNFENQLHLAESPEVIKQYFTYFKIAKLVADFIEKNNAPDNSPAYLHAYKLLILFGNNPQRLFHAFEKYLTEHNFQEKHTPLHDALIWSLPANDIKKTRLHLSAWRQIIYATGPKACRLFGKALAIEEALDKCAPKDFAEALEIAKLITFKRMKEDLELADLCMAFNMDEAIFNKCLELKKKLKTHDNLPQIAIDGKEVGHPGYHLVKLPINDPRAFILGHLTNCCQSIGGHSESCVIDGLTLKNNGFYVLLHEKRKASAKQTEAKSSPPVFIQKENQPAKINYSHYEIIGQSYAWMSHFGNLVFDSWENLRSEDDAIIIPLLEKFSQEVCAQENSQILRVCIGQGGKTPKLYKEANELTPPEAMREGKQYGDSRRQSLIYTNIALQAELYQKAYLALHFTLTGCNNPILEYLLIKNDEIYSVEQAEIIVKFLQENSTLHSYLRKRDQRLVNAMVDRKMPLAILALLDHAGLFTVKTIERLFECETKAFNEDCFIPSVTILYCAGILNPYFTMLINLEIPNFYLSRFVASELCELKNHNMLSEALVNTLIQKIEPSHWKQIIDGFVQLKSEDILTDKSINMLIKADQHAYFCAHALVGLKKAGLLIEPYLSYIDEAVTTQSLVAQALITLKKADILTEANIKLVLINHSCAMGAADALAALSKKLSPKEFNYNERFSRACQYKNIPLLQLLLEHNVIDFNEPTFDPLRSAAHTGNFDVMQLLFNAGISMAEKNCSYSLLHSAVSITHGDNSDAINLLIEKKSDINMLDHEGRPSLLFCLRIFFNPKNVAALLHYPNLKIDKEALLDTKSYFSGSDISNQKMGKAIVALHEAKLLNKENISFISNWDSSKEKLSEKLEPICASYDAKTFDENTLARIKSLYMPSCAILTADVALTTATDSELKNTGDCLFKFFPGSSEKKEEKASVTLSKSSHGL